MVSGFFIWVPVRFADATQSTKVIDAYKMLLNQIDSLPERKENEFIVNDRRNYIYRQGEKGFSLE